MLTLLALLLLLLPGCLVVPKITPGAGISLLGGSIAGTGSAGDQGPPVLRAVEPDSGGPEMAVRLTGDNLGASTRQSLQVFFTGAVAASPDRVDDHTILVKVPPGADVGNVVVVVGGVTSNGIPFRVLKSLTLNTSVWSLLVGRTLIPSLTGVDAQDKPVTDPGVTWSLSAGDAASLTGQTVTAKAPGDVTIRATSGTLTQQFRLHVFRIELVGIDRTALTLNAMPPAGDADGAYSVSARLTATVTASDGTGRKVNWSSSDTGRAAVDGQGLVQAARDAAPGTVVITASSADDPRALATASVTITDRQRLQVGID